MTCSRRAFLVQTADPFDIDVFLAQPLLARVAAAGPSVRAIWFLWEQGCFWWLTGSWTRRPASCASHRKG
jgi:hypothetical protein